MRIDLDKLRSEGYHVEASDRCVEIWPREAANPEMLIDILKEEYALAPMYVEGVLELVHKYQILSIIAK